MRIRFHSNDSLFLENPIDDHKEECDNVKLSGYLEHPHREGFEDHSKPRCYGSINRAYLGDDGDIVPVSMTPLDSESHDSQRGNVVPLLEEEKKIVKLYIRDGGYAWVVLAAMFCSNILTMGYMKGFGVFFTEIKEAYPAASGLMAGIMMGLLSGFRTIFAPFAGAMATAIGIRRTLCLGTAIYTIALFSSYFCTTLEQLSVTLGALIGISHCLIESVQVIIVSQYFESNLSLANGIRVGGNPCGLIVFPLLLTELYDHFGLKLMFILLAGVMMHIFVLAALLRPFETHFRINALDKANKIMHEVSSNKENGVSNESNIYLQQNSLDTKDIQKDRQISPWTFLGSLSNLRSFHKNKKGSLQMSTVYGTVENLDDYQRFHHSNQLQINNSLAKPHNLESDSCIYKESAIHILSENEKENNECSNLTGNHSEDKNTVAHQIFYSGGQNFPTKKDVYNGIVKYNQHLLKGKPKKVFNLGCLKNPHYLLFIFMAALIPMGNPLVLYYTTLYVKSDVGLTNTEVNIFLSFQAVFDFCLRFFLGWLNNKNLYKKSNGFSLCLLLSATGSSLMYFATGLTPLILLISLYTFGPASFHVFVNVILTEQFGKEKIASTWGFVRMTQGIFSFIHPVIIGYLVDSTGSYLIPFIVMGIGILMCGVFIFIENFLVRCTVNNESVGN